MKSFVPPREHASRLLHPPQLDDWTVSSLQNRERLLSASFFGLCVKDVRAELGIPSDKPVFLSGHQPVLLHPGLYAKLLAVSAAATRAEGLAYHKITDTDVPREWTFRYPAALETEGSNPFFDPSVMDIPYADLPAPSRERMETILDRCEASGLPTVREGCLAARSALLGLAGMTDGWSQFHYETLAGLDDQQALQRVCIRASRLFSGQPFHRYVAAWLRDLDNLGEHVNQALDRHRQEQDIRNEAEPAPNLRTEGSWREAPFWLAEEDKTRMPLWVKRTGTSEALLRAGTDGPSWNASWPDGLLKVSGPVRLWPKALPQSLFARLFLCDFFVHGIGGGRYEGANDLFFRDIVREEPPVYGVASATYYIDPDARLQRQGEEKKLREVLRWKRSFEQNPEYVMTRADRWVEGMPESCLKAVRDAAGRAEFERAVGEKLRLLEDLKDPGKRHDSGLRIREINETLRDLLPPVWKAFDRLERERQSLSASWESLSWREYPYFCYPPAVFADLKALIEAS